MLQQPCSRSSCFGTPCCVHIWGRCSLLRHLHDTICGLRPGWKQHKGLKSRKHSSRMCAWRGYDELSTAAAATGQEHVFAHWAHLDAKQQTELLTSLQELDFNHVNRTFNASLHSTGPAAAEPIEPWQDVGSLQEANSHDGLYEHGLRLIAQGKAAVLLLAGGQGTRLGSSAPKGCYNVGLPSGKSLFQVFAERVLKLQQLAAAAHNVNGNAVRSSSGGTAEQAASKPLLWYIMTSPFTHAETVAHFEEHSHFGLNPSQVLFFQQGSLPCFTEQGKIVLASASSIANAPDGNGGIYLALQRSGMLAHMAAAGVECLDCCSVDNLLARLGDPQFLGYCHSRQAQCGARAVAKAYPTEKVGVLARKGQRLHVVEYSELDPVQASAIDPTTNQLLYNWSNICMHYFSVSWLSEVAQHLQIGSMPYHVARKQIPSISGPVAGVKLELFIFDTFPLATCTAVMEVDRKGHFAPVKNAPGSAADSPEAARLALMQLHASWVQAAGGRVTGTSEGIEISPLVSYGGEGLNDLVKDKDVKSGTELR